MNLPGASAYTISFYLHSLKLTSLSKGWQQMEKLTAEVVDNQFQCVLSMEGSKKRAEEAIAFHFTHYLEDVEEGLITTIVLDPETDEIYTSKVELAHVLQFVAGCPTSPATGFNTNLTTVEVN